MSGAILFIEAPGFTEAIANYFNSDESYSRFQSALSDNPKMGSVIRGAPALRKARWSNSRRHVGKRGGLRIVYVFVPEVSVILLLDVYDKSEAEDLTQDERKSLSALAERTIELIRRNYQ